MKPLLSSTLALNRRNITIVRVKHSTRCNRKRAVTLRTFNCFIGHFTGTGDAAVSLLLAWIHILREQDQRDINNVNDVV